VNRRVRRRLVVKHRFRFGRDHVLGHRPLIALVLVVGLGLLHLSAPERLRGPLGSATLAPFLRVGGRNRRLENLAPVEVDVGILLFELAADVFVEGLASDFHVRRRAKPVQHARCGPAAALGGVNEVEVLVAAFVASKSQKSHQLSAVSYFLFVLRAGFAVRAGFPRAGGLRRPAAAAGRLAAGRAGRRGWGARAGAGISRLRWTSV
jgi:hypothetical protein